MVHIKIIIFVLISFFINIFIFSKISLKKYSVFSIILFGLLATSSSLAIFSKDGNTFYLTYSTVYLLTALIVSIFDIKEKEQYKFDFYIITIIFMILLICLQPLIFYIYDVKLFGHIIDSYLAIFSIYILAKKYSFLYDENFILKVITIFAICNALFSFAQFITGKPLNPNSPYSTIVYNIGYGDVKRVSGFIGSNNGAGNLGAILFTPLLYFFIKKPGLKTFIPFVSNIIFTILTFTRIGYVSIAVQVLIFLIYTNKKHIKALKKMRVAVILVFIGLMIYAGTHFDITVNALFLSRGETQQSRIDQFRRGAEIIKNNSLLGIGYGNYIQYAVNVFSQDDIIVHSQYINTLVESGIVGGVVFLIINIIPAVILMRKYKDKRWIAINIFLGNLIVINFNPNQYYYMNIFIYFYLLFNLCFNKAIDPKLNKEIV